MTPPGDSDDHRKRLYEVMNASELSLVEKQRRALAIGREYLVGITYEPLSVAAFAVGLCFVHLDRFETVQLAHGRDHPTVVLSDDGRLRDYNERAGEPFPQLADRCAIGERLTAVLPVVADVLEGSPSVVELERDEATRYLRVTTNPFGTGRSRRDRRSPRLDGERHRERRRRHANRIRRHRCRTGDDRAVNRTESRRAVRRCPVSPAGERGTG